MWLFNSSKSAGSDAQACPERRRRGNILSVYERASPTSAVKQTEAHIYGSSRSGIEQRSITYSTSPFAWIGAEQHRDAGTKRYELTDHLGNVRAVISDLLVDRPTGFGYATQDAEVIDRRDYYPFGMEMPGRRWRVTGEGAGRFGYNGKENDNEVKGEGNQQDYGFRIYDPRVARFLSVDPLTRTYPSWSPYPFAMNRPIDGIDIDGKEWGESRFADQNKRLIITRWLYAKVTKLSDAGLTNQTMWSILNKAAEYLATAMSSGDVSGVDYQMKASDVKFVHHTVGSQQADKEIDVVVLFDKTGYGGAGGATYASPFGPEAGDVRVFTHQEDDKGNLVMRPIDDIAHSLAHELGHQAGLPDANIEQKDPLKAVINKSVKPGTFNLMNQQVTKLQGPQLTPIQQREISSEIQRSQEYRSSLEEQRKTRNGENQSENVP